MLTYYSVIILFLHILASLIQQGARRVFAFASHGVFSGPASSRIAKSSLTELVVLDTIPLHPEAEVRPRNVCLLTFCESL